MDPEFGPQVKRLGSLPPSQQTIEKLNGSPPRTEKGRYECVHRQLSIDRIRLYLSMPSSARHKTIDQGMKQSHHHHPPIAAHIVGAKATKYCYQSVRLQEKSVTDVACVVAKASFFFLRE